MRVTFLIVQGPEGTENELNELKEKAKIITDSLPLRWNQATRGLSSISVFTPPEKSFAKGISLEFEEKKRTVSELRQEVEDILRKTHDDTPPLKRTIDQKNEDFRKFIGGKAWVQTITSPSQTAPPVQTATLSPINQFKEILSRLTAIKNELVDLLRRRREL